ncbi:MAG: DUF3090 family protein [Actinomycetota bacterium]
MTRSFDFDAVDRITAGAVGEPGDRTFYVQARAGARLVTLLAEKEQVALLGRALEHLMSSLPEGPEGSEPSASDLDLDEPLEPEWRVGEISIQYEPDGDRVVVGLMEATEVDESESERPGIGEPAVARFIVTRAQARALAGHALAVVSAGRPLCQLCGLPAPQGQPHVCPATNGHRAYRE